MALGVIARALPYAAKLAKELAKKKGSTTKFMGMVDEVPSKALRGPPSSVATGMGKKTAAATVAGGVGMASASRSDTKDEKKQDPAAAMGRVKKVGPSIDNRSARENRSAVRAADSKDASMPSTPNVKKKEAVKPVAASGGKGSNVSDRGKAFRAARAAGKSEFTFEGKKYHTRQAGETPAEHKAKMAGNSGSKPLSKLQSPAEFRAERDKEAARKKAVQDKAKKETMKKK